VKITKNRTLHIQSAIAQPGSVGLHRPFEHRALYCAQAQATANHAKASKAAAPVLILAAVVCCGCGKAKQPTPPSPAVAVTWQGLTTDYKGQTLVED